MTTSIATFRDRIVALPEFGLPLVTAFADLSRGGMSGEPTAWTVLEHALRNEAQGRDMTLAAAAASLTEDVEALRDAIAAAVEGGSHGLAYVGCAGERVRHVLALPFPLRNVASLDPVSPIFELDRAVYLHGQPVVLALVDMHTVNLTRFAFSESVATAGIEGDAHALMQNAHGRTKVEGRTGTPGSFSGGHSRNDVERVVRAHRLQFAAAAGEEVAGFMEQGDLLVIAGPAPARTQLLRALEPDLAASAVEATREPAGQNEPELVDFANTVATEARMAAGDRRAEKLLSGALGGHAVLGPEALSGSIETAQLGELVVHQDAAPQLGTASDARAHPGALPLGRLESLVRGAHSLSATITITRSSALLEEHSGVGGVLRW